MEPLDAPEEGSSYNNLPTYDTLFDDSSSKISSLRDNDTPRPLNNNKLNTSIYALQNSENEHKIKRHFDRNSHHSFERLPTSSSHGHTYSLPTSNYTSPHSFENLPVQYDLTAMAYSPSKNPESYDPLYAPGSSVRNRPMSLYPGTTRDIGETNASNSYPPPLVNPSFETSPTKSVRKRGKRRRKCSSGTVFKPPTLEDFCHRATWHGVRDFHASGVLGKMFWGSAIALAFVAACYGCYAIVAQYRESPVVISYMIHPAEDGRSLPDIVVCPFNRFNLTYIQANNVSDDLLEYIQLAFTLNTPYVFQRDQPFLPKNHSSYSKALDGVLSTMGNITFETFVNRASFSCNSLIDYCIYPDGVRDCCATAEAVMTPVGKCYRLVGIQQISSGFGFGMTVVINVPGDEYLSVGRNNLHNVGVSVKLAEAGKGLDFDLTFIPAGVHAVMPLRATSYEFINDPPRYECFAKVAANYSSVRCFDDCFFRPGMNACKCRHVTSPNNQYSACKPDEFFHCLITETIKELGDGKDYIKRCHKNCMTPCTYWAFHPTVSYASFPSSTFYQYVKPSSHKRWERAIILDVFYEKLEYTLIKHFPSMTPDTFIANIGGQVGLWVGGSILSLAQLIVFLCHYICSRFFYSENVDNEPTSRDSARYRAASSRNSADGREFDKKRYHQRNNNVWHQDTANGMHHKWPSDHRISVTRDSFSKVGSAPPNANPEKDRFVNRIRPNKLNKNKSNDADCTEIRRNEMHGVPINNNVQPSEAEFGPARNENGKLLSSVGREPKFGVRIETCPNCLSSGQNKNRGTEPIAKLSLPTNPTEAIPDTGRIDDKNTARGGSKDCLLKEVRV